MLTDTRVKQAKKKAKPYKLADEDGLYLYVSPTGAKSWRYDYRIAGLRETLKRWCISALRFPTTIPNMFLIAPLKMTSLCERRLAKLMTTSASK
jgi:hypothetical protein